LQIDTLIFKLTHFQIFKLRKVRILRQPYPHDHSFKKKIFNALLSGLIVTIFLRVFSPFGFAEAPVRNLNLFALGYGIVTASVIFAYSLFEKLFPKIFAEERWTVGKNILVYLLIIFLIGTANLFYTSIVAGMPLRLETFLTFQFFTLSVTFVVVSATTMIRYFRSMDFYKKSALSIDHKMHQLKIPSGNVIITIQSENEKENLQMNLNDLFYIEAADNYSKIVYRKDKKINRTLIRSSLKRLEDQFSQAELFRCHRTFIVQLRNVERVSGNSQGYRLHFKEFEESIPVSRRSGVVLHERIGNLNIR